jgi:hypothetical protein
MLRNQAKLWSHAANLGNIVNPFASAKIYGKANGQVILDKTYVYHGVSLMVWSLMKAAMGRAGSAF